MKYIAILLLFTTSVSGGGFNQAKGVYQRLVSGNGLGGAPALVLSPSRVPNAQQGRVIVITRGMLGVASNNNQTAVVLGHELAHWSLGHGGSTWGNEFAADSLGAKYAQNAGFNRCSGVKVLLKLSPTGSKTHPPASMRYSRVKC